MASAKISAESYTCIYDERHMLDLFPLTLDQVFKLPDLAVDGNTSADTYKSLFINELLSLELSAKRNLVPATYVRHQDGSASISLPDIILDVSSFYLFAHKTLVSNIFIFAKTIPRGKSRGITFRSYTAFNKDVQAQKNEVLKDLYHSCGKHLTWAQKAIIDKRDDLIQHWQGNTSNKFFTMVCAWDLPYLVYYNSKELDKIDSKAVDRVFSLVRQRIKAPLDAKSDALQKIVWMEAWQPNVSTQLQKEIDNLTNNELFISLPVTPQLIKRLDETIAGILEQASAIKI